MNKYEPVSGKYDAYIEARRRLAEFDHRAGVAQIHANKFNLGELVPVEEIKAMLIRFERHDFVKPYVKRALATAQKLYGIHRECRVCGDTATHSMNNGSTYASPTTPTMCFAHAKEYEREYYAVLDDMRGQHDICSCCGSNWSWFFAVGPKGGIHNTPQGRLPEYSHSLYTSTHTVAPYCGPLPGGRDARMLCGKCGTAVRKVKDNERLSKYYADELERYKDDDNTRAYIKEQWERSLEQAKEDVAKAAKVQWWLDNIACKS